MLDFKAFGSPSDRAERYSEDAMERVAEMPVINPDKAISRVFCKAKLRPAKVPVSSTSASFKPRTIEPTYCSRSSSSMAINASSWRFSSSPICRASGTSFATVSYADEALSSPFSIIFRAKVYPSTRLSRLYHQILSLGSLTFLPV